MTFYRKWPSVVCLPLLLIGCGHFFSSGASAAVTDKPRAAIIGDIRDENTYYGVVFYSSKRGAVSARDALTKLAEKMLPGVPVLSEPGKDAKPPYLGFSEEKAPFNNYPIPGGSYFEYRGRGLSPSDIENVKKSSTAIEVFLVVPTRDIWKFARAFTDLAFCYATETKAYLMDSETRECFSSGEWKTSRLDSWAQDVEIPDLSKHTTIDLYRPDDASPYLRAITLGLKKFGLPDLVIEQLIGSDNRAAANLINFVAQYLAENPVVKNGRNTEMNVSSLKNETIRKNFESGYLEKATGKVALALLDGKAREGDPDNSLIELSFENYEGKSIDEKRELAFAGLWGSVDSVKSVKHDDEILNASARAREHLPELRKIILTGLKPGQRILVKAPFQRDDEGREWMWVEVMDWKEENAIKGILQNDPVYIKDLKSGAVVTIKVADVFDYLLYQPDGTEEGNETGKIIERRQGEEKSK